MNHRCWKLSPSDLTFLGPNGRIAINTVSVVATSSFPINVPQGGSANAVMTATMDPSAPRSCSGVNFPITFSGTAGGPVTSR